MNKKNRILSVAGLALASCLITTSAQAQEWSMDRVAKELKNLQKSAPKEEKKDIKDLLQQFQQIEQQATPEQRAQIDKVLKALQNFDTSKIKMPPVNVSIENSSNK